MTPRRPARVLLADPPWQHQDALGKRGAAAHYPCMPVDAIARYPLPPLAEDGCLLLMWRLASMQPEALFVARAWGFVIKSEIVWDKTTTKGNPFFGLGRYVRASHETCLVGVRGRVQVIDRGVRSRFDAPVQEHSRKPDWIYDIAEALSEGPYVELFARRRRRGWTCLGNEVETKRSGGRRGPVVDPRQLPLFAAAE